MSEKELYKKLEEYDKEVNRLYKENKQLKEIIEITELDDSRNQVMLLQQRINRAIEYIKDNSIFEKDYSYFEKAVPSELLKILKGDNK